MGDIYTEKGITETPTVNIGDMSTASDVRRTGRIFDDIRDMAQEKAEKHQKLADNLYEDGSNIAIHEELERLSNDPNYANNPKAFAQEADKVASKIYSDIQNPEVRARVITNYELKKSPYINRAFSNMYRKQNEDFEYQTLSNIQKGMDDVGISIGNLMTGTFDVDDLRTLSESRGKLDGYLNSKDVNGFDMFTPKQRIEMEKQFNKNVLERLKGGYKQLGVHERQKIVDMLKNDSFGVSYVDKEGLANGADIKSIIPTDSYLDFKDFVLESHERASKLSGGDNEITQENQAIADMQLANSHSVESEIKTIKGVRKEKPVEAVVRDLELLDNMQKMGDVGLSKTDKKKYFDGAVDELLDIVKNDPSKSLSKQEDVFDDAAFQESVMSIGLQAMKHDGKMGGSAWADPMSVVMIRDFYSMVKEADLDPRATDSVSRDKARELASKAISNTIEMVVGGHNHDFNSMFLYGHKVSKKPLETGDKAPKYENKDYIIEDGTKHYLETGINLVPTA